MQVQLLARIQTLLKSPSLESARQGMEEWEELLSYWSSSQRQASWALLESAASHPEPEIRQRLVLLIRGKFPREAAAPVLLQKLAEDSEPEVCAEALQALAQQAGWRPESDFWRFCARFLRHSDAGVRDAAVWALEAWGRKILPVAGELVPLLQDPDVTVRQSAARALAGLGKQARPWSEHLFQAAAQREQRSPELLEALVQCSAAADTHRLLEILLDSLEHRDEWVVLKSIQLHTQLGIPEGLPRLQALSQQAPSPEIRHAAAEAVAKSGEG